LGKRQRNQKKGGQSPLSL